MLGRAKQALEALKTKGAKEGARFVWERGRGYVYDPGRVIILMRVDLTVPKNRIRPRDQDDRFQLLDLDYGLLPRIDAMLSRTEPARVGNAKARLDQGMKGYVAEYNGEIVGYVFHVGGEDDPSQRVHPDLDWIPIRPRADEVYTFDYFIAPDARGAGNLFARSVQQAHFDSGFRNEYGYVYATNKAALWLYRTIGWKEIGRITEHKVLLKFAVVQDRLYKIEPFSRTLVSALPKGLIR